MKQMLERELKSNTPLITKSLPLNKNIGTLLFEPLQTKLGLFHLTKQYKRYFILNDYLTWNVHFLLCHVCNSSLKPEKNG
jgi:hypothetical protein